MSRSSWAVLLFAAFVGLSCKSDNPPAPPTTGTVQGVAQTAVGDTVLAGVRVSTSPATSSVLTDAQGRYEIRDASPGQYVVTASKGGFDPGTINVSVIAGSVTTADILMSRTGQTEGSIQGQVKTSVGDSLVVGAHVETAPASSSVTTDQQGRYAILHVPPGSYTVAATKTGYNPGHTDVSVVSGQTTTADVRLTNVLVNTSPYEPVLLSPANAASNQTIPLTLRWSGDDPDDDPLSYDVYCDTLASPTLQIAAGQTESTCALTRLRGDATYYWRIIAHDNRGGSTPSQVSYFITRPDSVPVFCDWTMVDTNADSAIGDLRGISVSFAGSDIDQGWIDGGFVGFNDERFTPPIVRADAVGFRGSASAPYSYTFVFSGPVRNPVIHFFSLASDVTFSGSGTLVRLSGDSDFLVAGNVVSGMLHSASPSGTDSNGTIQLLGLFTSISFSAHYAWGTGEDGIVAQIGTAN